MEPLPFKANFWNDAPPPERSQALAGDGQADVVIVGAGLVGLSCAYSLNEAGLDVAVVERKYVGHASSGRHLGHVTPHMWNLGKEQPEQLAAWAQGCVDELEKVLADEGIECEFSRSPFWLPAAQKSAERSVQRAADYYRNLGLSVHSVETGKFDLVTFPTYGAMMLADQARMNPYLMVRGMRDTILRKGVRLYEGTSVKSVKSGPEVQIETSGGTLRAPKAILALNAYSGQFPFLQKYIIPSHSYAIVTEPLDESMAASLGPAENEEVMIFDWGRRGLPHYYQRFRRDRRLIFGGGSSPPAPAVDRLAPDDNQEVFKDIHTEMIRRYPALEAISIESAWGGSIGGTSGGIPIIAELPDQENVILALVGNGNGVGLGTNAGRLVKGLILGENALDAETRTFLRFCQTSV